MGSEVNMRDGNFIHGTFSFSQLSPFWDRHIR